MLCSFLSREPLIAAKQTSTYQMRSLFPGRRPRDVNFVAYEHRNVNIDEVDIALSTLPAFCDTCKAIEFDDSQLGGFAAQDQDAHPHLEVNGENEGQTIGVDFHIEDSYPDLPFLALSAAAGCPLLPFPQAEGSV
ncbi:hypothetical protein DL770_009480 [Monosporascus sp. CRB-9-2]|nr:hypothetical protein DL770_009480 [Monosporascus sp. CRB-9-2]